MPAGVFDMIALICWGVGWYKRRMVLVYIFIGMMAFDFFIDFCLFIIFMVVLNALYVAYFYPASGDSYFVVTDRVFLICSSSLPIV